MTASTRLASHALFVVLVSLFAALPAGAQTTKANDKIDRECVAVSHELVEFGIAEHDAGRPARYGDRPGLAERVRQALADCDQLAVSVKTNARYSADVGTLFLEVAPQASDAHTHGMLILNNAIRRAALQDDPFTLATACYVNRIFSLQGEYYCGDGIMSKADRDAHARLAEAEAADQAATSATQAQNHALYEQELQDMQQEQFYHH